MKTVLLILSIFIFSTSLFGQFDFQRNPYISNKIEFIADTELKSENHKMLFFVDSIFKIEKDYDFQFHFWHSDMTTPSASIFLMTLRNKKWSARYFKPNLNSKKDGKQAVEISINQTKLDQLWELLIRNDVLELPMQKEIKIPMKLYEIDTLYNSGVHGYNIEINDGELFEFELKTPHSSKYYSYLSPQAYLKYYKNIGEFYYAYAIILLINKYVGINDK